MAANRWGVEPEPVDDVGRGRVRLRAGDVLGVGVEDLASAASSSASAIASSAASFCARVARASPWLASRARRAASRTSWVLTTRG